MSTEVRLERLSQPDAEARLRASRLAVMAPGSIEQHGPHLPLGVEKILFVNWHEGNTPTLRLAGDSIQRRFNLRVVIAEAHLITNRLFGDRAKLTHAGNMETAAVLMYDPSLVHLDKATNPTPEEEGDRGHAIFRQKDVFPIMRDFREVAPTGWYGRPEEATPELASEIREKVSDYIVERARVEFARARP